MTPTTVIAVDCRSLIDERISGVATYTVKMIQALKQNSNLELLLFYQNGKKAEHLHKTFPEIQWVEKSSNFFHLKCLLKRPALPGAYFSKKPDLIWMPDRRPFYETKLPVVMTIHDMVPTKLPRSLSWRSRLWHTLFPTKSLIKYADGLLAPSFTVEQDLPRSIPRRVTYEGGVLKGDGVLPKRCPKKFTFILAPLDPRKRVNWVLKLAKEFPKDKFVWAGVKSEDPRFAKLKTKLSSNIKVYGEISNQEKIGLMRRAECLFALSEYEGFDLPVLEAVRLKCPVVLSDISVHRELYRGTNFVSNYEELKTEYLRSRIGKLSIPKTRGVYTWEKSAKTALLFFHRIIENKNR
ncbi:MAG: glycosyltransferase involved in cell wall biosynthesis [Oceanicoccus sp.]|jgi:glycosyltransferase involved in cell wall biosynthesis